MGYARLDDGFWANPKVTDLPPLAFRLYVRAISFSSAYNTGGKVSEASLRALEGTPKLVEILTAADLWEGSESGWKIHDFDHYNVSQAKRKSGRENARARWKPDAATNVDADGLRGFASCETDEKDTCETGLTEQQKNGNGTSHDAKPLQLPGVSHDAKPDQPHLPEVGGAARTAPAEGIPAAFHAASTMMGRELSAIESEVLAEKCDDYLPAWVTAAINRTREQGVRSLTYAWRVLEGYGADGPPQTAKGDRWDESDDTLEGRKNKYLGGPLGQFVRHKTGTD